MKGVSCRKLLNAKDPFRIVIVRDMWLTGFDAPCLHTMYVDKPMQGHGLMQAIARVNRVLTPSLPSLGRASPSACAPSVSHAPTCSAQKQAGRADRELPRAGGSAHEGLATYTESGGRGNPTFDTAAANGGVHEARLFLGFSGWKAIGAAGADPRRAGARPGAGRREAELLCAGSNLRSTE